MQDTNRVKMTLIFKKEDMVQDKNGLIYEIVKHTNKETIVNNGVNEFVFDYNKNWLKRLQ